MYIKMCVRISDGVGVVFSLSAGGERTGQVLLLYVGHAVPQVAAQLRADGLQLVQNVPYFGAVRAFLIRAVLLLPGIVARAAQLHKVVLGDEAERADYCHVEFLHGQPGRHGGKRALEGHVHEQSLEEVILVMAEGYLVAASLPGDVEECLAPIPGA